MIRPLHFAILAAGIIGLWAVAYFLALRYAVLIAALVALAGVFAWDRAQRRDWEGELESAVRKLREEHERLVREVARGRHDLAQLRQGLAEAGNAARGFKGQGGQGGGAAAESRMLQAIAEKLSRLGALSRSPANDAPEFEDDALDRVISSAPGGADIQSVLAAGGIDEGLLLRLIDHAIKNDRISMFTQPIVSLPQRKLRHCEIFSRIQLRPGVHLPAGRYIGLARKRDLVPAIDSLLLLRCLQQIRDTGTGEEAWFCNITQTTLLDSAFMGDLVEFISHNRDMAGRLVFEMAQDDLQMLDAALVPVLEGLARLGCRFSMDQVTDISLDLDLLKSRHVRFVKIDAGLMLRRMEMPGGLRRLQLFKSELDRAGIDLIVERIESERDLVELLDVHIDYGQGYLFGRPEIRLESQEAA